LDHHLGGFFVQHSEEEGGRREEGRERREEGGGRREEGGARIDTFPRRPLVTLVSLVP